MSDEERLTRAVHVLKAAVVAMDAKHVNTYTRPQPGKSVHSVLSQPMECAHSLIQEMLEHRRDLKRVIAKREIPDKGPPSITWQLLQVLHVLKLAIYAYATEPEPADGIDFSYPLHAIVKLLEQTHDELYEEDDEKFIAENPELLREAELMGAGAAKEPLAGTPN